MQRVEIIPGAVWYPQYLDRAAQEHLRDAIRDVVRVAPLFQPTMPRTGKPFSVRMTNCGSLGWVSDKKGYRYQPQHPDMAQDWPPMPEILLQVWRGVSGFALLPEACLVNFYDSTAKMGLHQDRDEQEMDAPVVSVSLGDTAIFRIGGTTRGGPTQSVKLESGDVFVFGGAARLAFHGIDRLVPGSSTLLSQGGRINLTLRRVTKISI
ncbi:MAG: alpha-ketoglutarate-dependent dioxygenase AlkB family protein [Beijerinckiaceae bacterium]